MLTEKDLEQIKEKRITSETIDKQLENFRQGFPAVELVAPATPGKGIDQLGDDEEQRLAGHYEKASKDRGLLKFVPASGAATRMFKHLFNYLEKYRDKEANEKELLSDKGFNSVYNFFFSLKLFPFFNDLRKTMEGDGLNIDHMLANKEYGPILEYLLTEKGLNFGNLPKGLIPFHTYVGGQIRTPLEEHMAEGANYCADRNQIVNLHFTVSPEHRLSFQDLIDDVVERYEEMFKVKYNINFSEQKPSTDTIAVDMDNEPFREEDGTILFRPGGHGALIENLNDLKGDIVFIKNIDNVVPDDMKPDTYLYKKVLAGYLLELQQEAFGYLEELEKDEINDSRLLEIGEFAEQKLNIIKPEDFSTRSTADKRKFLVEKLNRPIRVCGMVKNEGEPGGGPFWIKDKYGQQSLQIVESSQMDLDREVQQKIVDESTHFNPVDLVCGLRDYKGNNFNLKDFVEPSTGFISTKSKNGRSLKAQELPGLWNGAMAFWNTIFVEVPITTFNPVKTINDLLRKQHQ
ncbi:MAG: DUF4301 family protein [Bacteroidales bacterium]|nr:DUF4301 family protein [Bacteroidales bacterium]